MQSGTIAYFDSMANDGTLNAGFGLQMIGSQGMIDIKCDRHPLAHLVAGNPFRPPDTPRSWVPISSAGPGIAEPRRNLEQIVSRHLGSCRDLVDAIRSDRQPLCNVYEGAMTVEMICGVFASHRHDSKAVSFPLEERSNALATL
jgi:hypothetical protein